MPLLSYSAISDFPFQRITKIYSSDVNLMFTTIQTLLNTTGLDDTNLQAAGISITKLKTAGGSAGQVVGNNGTSVVWVDNPVGTQYNVIFGSAAQVTSGIATNSTFASWTQVAGDRVLVLPTYTEAASWALTANNLLVVGLGAGSIITGSLTVGGTENIIKNLRTTDNITVNGNKSSITEVYLATGKTFVDNSTASYLEGIQE